MTALSLSHVHCQPVVHLHVVWLHGLILSQLLLQGVTNTYIIVTSNPETDVFTAIYTMSVAQNKFLICQ